MVVPDRRASAFGPFTAGYGVSWFLGSALMGIVYQRSLTGVVGVCLGCELAALPIFWMLTREGPRT